METGVWHSGMPATYARHPESKLAAPDKQFQRTASLRSAASELRLLVARVLSKRPRPLMLLTAHCAVTVEARASRLEGGSLVTGGGDT